MRRLWARASGASPYKQVLVGTIAGTIALVLALLVLTQRDELAVLTVIVVAEFLAGFVASIYLTVLNVTSRLRPRSWVLMTLATAAWEITIGAACLIVILVANFAGAHLPPGAGLTLVGMSFVLQLAAPITTALVIWLQEHRGGHADGSLQVPGQ